MKWAFLFLACLAAFDGAVIGLLFKGVRRRALWMAAASVVGMTLALSMFQFERNDEARKLGFLDASDRVAAKDAGVIDPAVWRLVREAKRQIEGRSH